MPYVNDTAVEVLIAAAEQLRGVLTLLEQGRPVDQAQLECVAVNLFTIVNVLGGVDQDVQLERLERAGPPLPEEELCDVFLRAASEQLPAARAHVVILASRLGRAPYCVSNIPPLAALELLERCAVKITTLRGVSRRVEEIADPALRAEDIALHIGARAWDLHADHEDEDDA